VRVKRALIPLAALVLFGWLSAGCVKLGPDFQRPAPTFAIPDTYRHAVTPEAIGSETDPWWYAFNDPDLNRVAEEVLENNLDVKKAGARILELSSRFVQVRGDRFPFLEVEGSAQRQRVAMSGVSGMIAFPEREQETYVLSFPVSFELDLWGRLARAEEAARAELLEASETRKVIVQSVLAEAMNLYFLGRSLEQRISIAEESIGNYRRSLDLVERRYQRGLSSIVDVRQARRTLAQAESVAPALRQELGIAQQQLAVLVGTYPETHPARDLSRTYSLRLAPVPAGVPSDLLLRRPDIRAAENRLMAQNARVGEAKAARFPRIAMTGRFGYSSGELSALMKPESELWSLALGVMQPLFDAGKRKAVQRAAEARFQQELSEYAKTVLGAFSEVESALLSRKEQLERRERILVFVREARATQEAAESRYVRGLVNYLTVLEAQQTRFQAEENLVLVDLALLANRITLHRSLGGGWPEPVSPKGGDAAF